MGGGSSSFEDLEAKCVVDFEDVKSEDVHMIEAVIAPKSRFAGKPFHLAVTML
jgi:hypothetical protein